MHYRILGPLEVLDDEGRPVALRGRREQLLLVTLLLEANKVVSRDRLIDAIWGDNPPQTADNALQVLVSQLRKTLIASSDAASPLHTQAPGYILRTAPGELDSDRFEELSAASPPSIGPALVSERLTEALALWRGPVLNGIDTDLRAQGDVARLEELRLSTTVRRIDADLALGSHRDLVGELEALVRAHPLHEGLVGQLMVALYRSGRQADALGVYRSARLDLAGELGIDPGPELQELELAILNQAPELALRSESDRTNAPLPSAGDAGALPGFGIPLPGRLAALPTLGVVGRDEELALVAAEVARAASGDGHGTLLIAGEAGLGKTTLVAEAARRAHSAGACILMGHCEEDVASPYKLFAEALTHYVLHAPAELLTDYVERYGSELVRLVPALAQRIPDLPPSKAADSDSERYLLFVAVVGLLSMASQGQAMIVVFDDLQWADQGSLLLMRHVAGSDLPMNLLVLATYRDTEITNSTPFVETLGALRRSRNMSRIDLAGLDSSGVLSLMEVAAGHALEGSATALADALHRETDGNPFFLSEVLRHLRDTGAIYEDAAGRWTSQAEFRDVPLPDSVREVIRARVVRLGADAERVLSLAAVIGRDFDLDLLARATQESPDVLLDVLEAAASVALVREMDDSAGQYSFSHALIQHTMYEHLSRTRRAQAHLVVGRALEDVCAGQPGARVGELARHWLIASQPVDVRKAIDYARQAAEAALSALAPDDALRYFSQALELCDQVGEPSIELRLRLGIGQGIAQRQTGDPAFRETLLGAARTAADLDDTELLVTAILANDRGTLSTLDSVDTEKIELLEIALDRVPEAHPHRALLLSTLCSELTMGSPLERRVSLGEQAAAIARRSGDDTTIVRVFNHIDLPLAVPSLLAESLARTAEALERAHLIGDPILLCASASARRFAAACAGDIQEMDRCFAVKDPLVEQLDQPFLNWVHALQRVTRALIAGDVDQAETWATTAFQIGNDGGQPDAFVIFGAQHITVSLFRGTMGDQIPLIMQAITANPGLDVFKAVLTLAHAEAGNEDEVRVLLDEFADSGFELPQDPTWLTGMIAYADAAVACSDPRHAGDLLERLAPFAEQWLYTDVTTSGPVSHSLGGLAALLGRFDDADAYFARAAADSERTAATYFAARTEISWGGMLLERNAVGDLDSGRGLVVNAREVASARGYQGLERRATEILQHGD